MINFLYGNNKKLHVVGPSPSSLDDDSGSSCHSQSSFAKPNGSLLSKERHQQQQRRGRRRPPAIGGNRLKSESDHGPSSSVVGGGGGGRRKNTAGPLVTSKSEHGSMSRRRPRFPSAGFVGSSSSRSNSSSKNSNGSNGNGNKNQTQKSVRFERKAQVKRVKPRHLYNETEREAMWHTETDYALIKRGAVETVQLMARSSSSKAGGGHNASFAEDEHRTARGLECRLREAALQRKEFKNYARDVVLGEQAAQYIRGVPNPSRIRDAYLEASAVSLQKARRFAARDQEAARRDDECGLGGGCLRAIVLAVREEHERDRCYRGPQQ